MSDFAQSGYDTFLTGLVSDIDDRMAATEAITLYTMTSPMLSLTTKANGGDYNNGDVITWNHYAGGLPFSAQVYAIDHDTGFRYLVPCVPGNVYQNGLQLSWDNHLPSVVNLYVGTSGIRVLNNHGDDVNVLGSVRRNHFSLFVRALFDRKPDALSSTQSMTTQSAVPNDMNDNT